MMYVLDTNVLSELRKVRHGKADANVAAWAASVHAADLFGDLPQQNEVGTGVLESLKTGPDRTLGEKFPVKNFRIR